MTKALKDDNQTIFQKIDYMSFIKAKVKVIGADECPMYRVGDEFRLSGKSLIPPYSKPACLILARDITEIFLKYDNIKNSRFLFNCSGCSGIARLEHTRHENGLSILEKKQFEGFQSISTSLSKFPFFKSFDEKHVQELVNQLKTRQYLTGEEVVKKGEPGKNLYIIAAGSVEVLNNDGMRMAILGRGEIFGEMSLISGDPVNATVRAIEPLTVLFLNGLFFREILYQQPTIQIYLTRILARRIADANIFRAREIATGLVGNLTKISASELFQTLHINQKTGVLLFNFPDGMLAGVSFFEGKIIRAKFGESIDEEAVTRIIRTKEGRFKFSPELPPEEKRTEEVVNIIKVIMENR